MNFEEAVTFEDVLLAPRRSSIASRRQVDTTGRISRNIPLKVPIISANMDTVTESEMAIAMAHLGGLGVIHRFLKIEEEACEVARVKRAESIVIEQPYALAPSNTVREARRMMRERGIGGILVVAGEGRLAGLVTTRDIVFERDGGRRLEKVMTRKLITARPDVRLDEARRILQEHDIEKLPLVDKDGLLRGLITAKDLLKNELYPNASKDAKGHLLVGAAVGVVGDFLERAQALHDAGADVLVVDVAHGHSDHVIEAVRRIKACRPSSEVVAGNVATYEGALDLVKAGADGVKVGVGPGAACSTRIVAGCGVPQVSAILDCAQVTRKQGVPIISDGGIRDSGAITKALAAGASSVMLGSLLAGSEESPGYTTVRGGVKYKVFRGMASLGAALGRRIKERDEGPAQEDISEVVPEGVESVVPYRGNVSEVVHQLAGGLRSGMSYCGADDLRALWKNARFVRITPAGLSESKPHVLDVPNIQRM
ncbi:MAG: IMP dehydrogenase [Elusimicrobia bacterium]|nr:IMP dehydrogenase [Elusimicrobiota bacterium]